ncbi:MAG: M14 family metallopeptidase [Cyclobacteriaceae bacterium]|nr:zinc carboxypeptidase [Cyclobacteriaceae bacterium]MCH8517256.1 M14 family metallopeptidase [Cyclobacteriaceae bacterium]
MNRNNSVLSLITAILLIISQPCLSQIQSPKEFFGVELGQRFTPYPDVEAYFQHLSENDGRVDMEYYGESTEGRPLWLMFIGSEPDIKEKKALQEKYQALANGKTTDDLKPLVWMSYNVHGNEAVGTESAIRTIYHLLTDEASQKILDDIFIIMDPCLNPDGRERYVNFYRENIGKKMDVQPWTMEHLEPWPGGRPNHFFFDLNRDWLWQSQQESQLRMKQYLAWQPQVHIDFHEQNINSPYYFAPAAKPYHSAITDWQKEFQRLSGENIANYFDQRGEVYFTKERFDLFYPSYGDTYPTFNGAIGMTMEQGGSGRAGLGVLNETKDTLTLEARIENHHYAALGILKASQENPKQLIDKFKEYRASNTTKNGFEAYLIDKNTPHLASLLTFFDRNQVKYEEAKLDKDMKSAYNYHQQKTTTVPAAEYILIPTEQPSSTLIDILFEKETDLEDSLTYDLTAWSIPFAYGANTYGINTKLSTKTYEATKVEKLSIDTEPYALIIPMKSKEAKALYSHLKKEKYKLRIAQRAFEIEDKKFPRGTAVITRADNRKKNNWHNKVAAFAAEKSVNLVPLKGGYAASGFDIGSDYFTYREAPKVVLLGGDGISSLDYGSIWHYFENELQYPVHRVNLKHFGYIPLDEIDVIIMPSGSYSSQLKDEQWKQIESWVKRGGRLIATERAASFVARKRESSFESKEKDETKKEAKLSDFENVRRESVSSKLSGGIFNTKMDSSHPLALGYESDYFLIKSGEVTLPLLKSGDNYLIHHDDMKAILGFTGSKAKDSAQGKLIMGVESVGRGEIVYMTDNPLFRAFWENGKRLYFNAVFHKM